MKTTLLLVIGAIAGQQFFPPSAGAQTYSPRQLTRRVPNIPNRPGAPVQPATPGKPAPPATVAPNQPPAPPNGAPGTPAAAPTPPNSPTSPTLPVRRLAPVVVARPVDPEKARAAQEEAQRKAVEFQKQRAAEDFGWAQYALGVRHMTGHGVEKDFDQARKLLEQAAKNGEGQARKKLAELDKLTTVTGGSIATPPALPTSSAPSAVTKE